MAKKIELNGLECYLLPQKALYIPKYELLVISDWHLGKLSHFRKEGIFVPAPAVEEELNRFQVLMEGISVKEVIFLGDLFHSSWNSDWEKFRLFINSYHQPIKFFLTKGNHDILSDRHFEHLNLEVRSTIILTEGIVFSHEPLLDLPDYLYNIVGHIHPGCLIETKARQSFRLPCFYLNKRTLILPAFGKFTGLHLVKKDRYSKIFAIVNDQIIAL